MHHATELKVFFWRYWDPLVIWRQELNFGILASRATAAKTLWAPLTGRTSNYTLRFFFFFFLARLAFWTCGLFFLQLDYVFYFHYILEHCFYKTLFDFLSQLSLSF